MIRKRTIPESEKHEKEIDKVKNDPKMQQCLAVYVRDVIGRAKQPDCAERAMVVQLGKEDPADYPCAMFTEGVAIPLDQLSVVMDAPDKNIVTAEFDRNRRYWWTASEGFQIKKLCFDLENDRIYAAGTRDQNIYMPTELLLRAQADGVYFVARAKRGAERPLHFAYTKDPELKVILDDLVDEKQREMLQKGVVDDE